MRRGWGGALQHRHGRCSTATAAAERGGGQRQQQRARPLRGSSLRAPATAGLVAPWQEQLLHRRVSSHQAPCTAAGACCCCCPLLPLVPATDLQPLPALPAGSGLVVPSWPPAAPYSRIKPRLASSGSSSSPVAAVAAWLWASPGFVRLRRATRRRCGCCATKRSERVFMKHSAWVHPDLERAYGAARLGAGAAAGPPAAAAAFCFRRPRPCTTPARSTLIAMVYRCTVQCLLRSRQCLRPEPFFGC